MTQCLSLHKHGHLSVDSRHTSQAVRAHIQLLEAGQEDHWSLLTV